MAGMPTIFLCLSKGLPMRRALNKRCDTILAHHLRGDHCMSIAIVVHGGAGTITPERAEIAQAGCKEAAQIGWRVLENGGCALDAVEAAVRALENNPDYNAGTGSCLTADGRIELDAGIMEGEGLHVGAVASVEGIKNPISLARMVMDSPHVLLVGKGAQTFAHEQGMPLCTFEELLTERQYLRWKEGQSEGAISEEEPRYHRREVNARPDRKEKHGTVGAVAVDSTGILAAATSTGGIPNKYSGRIGNVGFAWNSENMAHAFMTENLEQPVTGV